MILENNDIGPRHSRKLKDNNFQDRYSTLLLLALLLSFRDQFFARCNFASLQFYFQFLTGTLIRHYNSKICIQKNLCNFR